MRILVTGSRDLTDDALVRDALINAIPLDAADVTIVVGDCPTGADRFARGFADFDGDAADVHIADWTTHGKAAGPLRNQAMVDSGADVCLAFYRQGASNRGTSDCVRRARASGIEVYEFTEKRNAA
jgi:hypothetical protein